MHDVADTRGKLDRSRLAAWLFLRERVSLAGER
jgi:hypothetical protein